MKVSIINEQGIHETLMGLGLSYGLTSNIDLLDLIYDVELIKKLLKVTITLAFKGLGHSKFLESIQMWIDITAPIFWWNQFDTYRVGISKQSESKMHTILKVKEFTSDMFELGLEDPDLDHLNDLLDRKQFEQLINDLPQGFLQRRIVNLNYKTLQNIVQQRKSHKLAQWKEFVSEIEKQSLYPEFLFKKEDLDE